MQIFTIFLSMFICGTCFGKIVNTSDIQVGDSVLQAERILARVGAQERTEKIGAAYFYNGGLTSARSWRLPNGEALMITYRDTSAIEHILLLGHTPYFDFIYKLDMADDSDIVSMTRCWIPDTPRILEEVDGYDLPDVQSEEE